MSDHYLQHLFAPRSVAVVGASARSGSLGHAVLSNLREGSFKGALYPVNPKYGGDMINGLPCYASLADLPQRADLAVVVTPARTVAEVLRDAARAGTSHAVVLSAGFGETGAAGRALEDDVLQSARTNGLRLIGPNCLGIMRPAIGLNATFARGAAKAGSIALVSQSGAICSALTDWAWSAGIGFSSVISLGAATDLDFGEILDYLLYDEATRSILLYVEGVHDARRFIGSLRAAARSKPIVVLKVGRHTAGSRAAMSHTGAMVGDDAVFDAVLRRSGVVRASTYGELFSAARLLGAGRLPAGERLAILTNGGGPGVMAADCASDYGLTLASLAEPTRAALDAALPPHWSHGNPVDIIGDATPARLSAALVALLGDPGVDGVLTMICPQIVMTAVDAARAVLPLAQASAKPVLSEPESKQLLACFGIATPRTLVAATLVEAIAAGTELGYPLVMKIVSPDIAHKSDVQGVALGVRDLATLEQEFRNLLARTHKLRPNARIDGVAMQPMIEKRFGRELLIGVARDPVFGQVISFGAGGVAVELLRDHAIGLPPLNRRLAEDLIDRTRIARLLAAYRHIPAAQRDAIVDVLVRVSDMVCALPWLEQMDINPLTVDDAGAVALDARVIIDPSRFEADLRYSHLAIHPYPARLEGMRTLRDGTLLAVRPIRPEDAQMELAFFDGLSEQSRFMRFFSATRQMTPRMLARFTQVDYETELALIALVPCASEQGAAAQPVVPAGAEPERMVGVARYTPTADGTSCEFAVTVADQWQGRGLATLLMQRLIDAARDAGYQHMRGSVLSANAAMRSLMLHLRFRLQPGAGDPSVLDYSLALTLPRPGAAPL